MLQGCPQRRLRSDSRERSAIYAHLRSGAGLESKHLKNRRTHSKMVIGNYERGDCRDRDQDRKEGDVYG